MQKERLDKTVALMCGVTRSEAKAMIKRGSVSVNGKTVVDISQKFNTEWDVLAVNGKTVEYEQHVYYLLNKPKGVLSAARDKHTKTVLDLIEPQDKRNGLFCVGRLDKDTTGLLLITDDGELGHRLISPKSNIAKTYAVTLDGTVTAEMAGLFKAGVTLADGYICKPAELNITGDNTVLITVTEGKYHQIKRMFGVVGLGVNELKRIKEGNVVLPYGLEEGKYIKLSESDVHNFLKNDIK